MKTCKNWIVVLLLIVFFPVGLYLMWARTNWKKNVKIVVTIFIAVLFIIGASSSAKNGSKDNANSTTSFVDVTTEPTTAVQTTEEPTTVAPTTEKPTEKVTEAPTEILITSITSSVNAGETASVSIQGAPNTEYYITVTYKSGKSTAAGLEAKTSDGNGNVSWSWEVGAKTSSGTYPISISGGGTSAKTEFTIN